MNLFAFLGAHILDQNFSLMLTFLLRLTDVACFPHFVQILQQAVTVVQKFSGNDLSLHEAFLGNTRPFYLLQFFHGFVAPFALTFLILIHLL
jgi:hypothetical protein